MIKVLILLLAQGLFSMSDLLGRKGMAENGFTVTILTQSWFPLYLMIHLLAMVGQLYIFANFTLGKSMILFGAVSILLSNALGLIFLKEQITSSVIISTTLVIAAMVVLFYE